MRVLLRDHAAAEPAAELDLASGLVAEDVLHQERHAAKRAVAERALVERLDAVGIRLDDRVHGGIDRGDRRGAVAASSVGDTCFLATSAARPRAS